MINEINTRIIYGILKVSSLGANFAPEKTVFWDWSQWEDASLSKLIGFAVTWGYRAFLLFSVVFSGYKFANALINYFNTSNSNVQLKIQYRNDMKEVMVGFAMFFVGVNVLAFFANFLVGDYLEGGFWNIFSGLNDLVDGINLN